MYIRDYPYHIQRFETKPNIIIFITDIIPEIIASQFEQMSEEKFVENFYDTTAYTADISTKMRIPEHINAHGSHSNGDPFSGKEYGRQNRALYEMQVPDRWESAVVI